MPIIQVRALTVGILILFGLTGFGGAASAKGRPQRVVYADVVAINQPIVYNRFGSANPWGMIYALRSDVDTVGCKWRDPAQPRDSAPDPSTTCRPGEAMLKPGVRPRPLVLRVAQGDRLIVRFQNLLMPMPEHSRSLTPAAVGNVPISPALTEVQKVGELTAPGQVIPANGGIESIDPRTVPHPPDDPMTRLAGIAVVGLKTLDGDNPIATGLQGLSPGESAIYTFDTPSMGSYFFSSLAAIQGGEGDGGSLTHGLFGLVIVEPASAKVYRSQISAVDMACARGVGKLGVGCVRHGPIGQIDYEAERNGTPVLATHVLRGGEWQILHGDLTAVVVPPPSARANCAPRKPSEDVESAAMASWKRDPSCPFREFAIMFHDELKTVHAPAYAILNGPTLQPGLADDSWDKAQARHRQLAGARDGFAINYGSSGMGTALISNRAGVGPARTCVDCAYEEFFLQSWANGDPALLPQYANDPSNVYHSYMGDAVEFHNVHAGPKETHVFHLHAHQWLSQDANAASSYLDSQTIGPFQTFQYGIAYGGSGNRNLAPGDSIFHCHLYPHFAQGMWGLWRTHDVFEDGSRLLPDGGGLNAAPGSQLTEWQGPGTNAQTGAGQLVAHQRPDGITLYTGGTPIPALVPLPRMPLAPQPTYAANGMPGYPFYIPGKPGFRAPQPPLDMAKDGGLPRHLTLTGEREAFGETLGNPARASLLLAKGLEKADLTFHIKKINLQLLPQEGTPLEKAAMAWHSDPNGHNGFAVNGRPAAPGSPYGNPCPANAPKVRYEASAIELDLLVNQYGWHDPQARINVLDSDVDKYAGRRRAADPFFFRVHSGDCITFQHTNRTGAKTISDPFQVAAPTDIIGQHIHLVKFDVTSSDGSANGFNYEDGTLARSIIEELITASKGPGGSVLDESGMPRTLTADGYQATLQRWWADPRFDSRGKDQTLGTVFTHDHFGPSNIQQHGFYSALLVEPKHSEWFEPNGTPMIPQRAVGTQAIIRTDPAKDPTLPDHLAGTHREFALAVADFALLYDGQALPELPYGRPIAPPQRAEAISVDHHDPYLFNYRNEPLPRRLGRYDSSWKQETGQRGDLAYIFSSEVHRAAPGFSHTDLAAVDLRRNHADGDPSTEIFEAYVGDKAIMRMIQGAQEVQHVFEINGLSWHRQPGDPNSPRVASQEMGISEHFEFDLSMPLTTGAYGSVHPGKVSKPLDFLYSAGTVDALWNGAWGLIRTYANPRTAADPGKPGYWDMIQPSGGQQNAAVPTCDNLVIARLATTDAPTLQDCATRLAAAPRFSAMAAGDPANPPDPDRTFAGVWLRGNYMIPDLSSSLSKDLLKSSSLHLFCLEAAEGNIVYNQREGITDPNGRRYRLISSRVVNTKSSGRHRTFSEADFHAECASADAPPPGDDAPLVLRMAAGDFAIVGIRNSSFSELKGDAGSAVLPPIAPSSGTDRDISAHDIASRLVASAEVAITPQLVAVNTTENLGFPVGLNLTRATREDLPTVFPGYPFAMPAGETPDYKYALWFAGTIQLTDYAAPGKKAPAFKPFVTERGMAAGLVSMADPIKHAAAGLVGALVIEPAESSWTVHADDPTRARVRAGRDRYEEAVLVYQDGLNLKINAADHPRIRASDNRVFAESGVVPIPDCHICDDSYDSGDVAVNFRAEPFWARINAPWIATEEDGVTPMVNPDTGRPALVDLNAYLLPADIWTRPVGPLSAGMCMVTPAVRVAAGDELVFQVVHPGGRARQRAFITYGHRYDQSGLKGFGSPSSALMAPRKDTTAIIGKVEPGRWLWRDGPAQFVGGGVWGTIEATGKLRSGKVYPWTDDQRCPIVP